MDGEQPIRAGIIGLGKMGNIRAHVLRQRNDVRLVCGYDPAPAVFQSQWPEVICHENVADLLASDIDVIFVCVPNAVVAATVVAALAAGKHVFSEKPPGCCVDDVLQMQAAEIRHPGLKLAFGFNHRFHAGIQEAHRIASSGLLGELLWIRGVYGKPDQGATWRREKALAGGGILLDQGIHLLDLVGMFLGPIVDVKSMVTTAHWESVLEDNAFALLRNGAGRIAQIHSSSTQWKHRFTFEVFLEKGSLVVDGILSASGRYGEETLTIGRKAANDPTLPPVEEILFFDEDPSWATELDVFLACVRDDTPVVAGSSAQALETMTLVHAIYADDGAP